MFSVPPGTTSTPYLYNVVYAYETAEVGLAAGKGALNLVEALAEQKEAGQLLAEILAELSNLKKKNTALAPAQKPCFQQQKSGNSLAACGSWRSPAARLRRPGKRFSRASLAKPRL